MKRLDIILAIAAAAILGGWSWLSWPGHVTAIGVTALVAPLYVAVVSLLIRQDAPGNIGLCPDDGLWRAYTDRDRREDGHDTWVSWTSLGALR